MNQLDSSKADIVALTQQLAKDFPKMPWGNRIRLADIIMRDSNHQEWMRLAEKLVEKIDADISA